MPRQWAADPSAPVRVGPRGERLTPRGSGAVFRAVVRGRSLPWTVGDRVAARELWRLLTALVLRHAEVLDAVNEELRMRNVDLDSFAHAAAHDLKEPLRGISNAATFAMETRGTGSTRSRCGGCGPCSGSPGAWTSCSTRCCTTPGWAAPACGCARWSSATPWTRPWRWPDPGWPSSGWRWSAGRCRGCGRTPTAWTRSWSTCWSTPPSTPGGTGSAGSRSPWSAARSRPPATARARPPDRSGSSSSGTTGSASRRSGTPTSSTCSAVSTGRPSTAGGRGWGWPWSSGSSSGTGAASGWRPSPAGDGVLLTLGASAPDPA